MNTVKSFVLINSEKPTEFLRYLNDSKFCDATLACGGQSFKVHRLILSSASPYFEDIFYANDDKQLVLFIDTKPEILAKVLDFVYKRETTILEEHFDDFTELAKKLQLKGIETHDQDLGTEQPSTPQQQVKKVKFASETKKRTSAHDESLSKSRYLSTVDLLPKSDDPAPRKIRKTRSSYNVQQTRQAIEYSFERDAAGPFAYKPESSTPIVKKQEPKKEVSIKQKKVSTCKWNRQQQIRVSNFSYCSSRVEVRQTHLPVLFTQLLATDLSWTTLPS